MTSKLNLNTLTMGEVSTIEDLTGVPFDLIASEDKPKVKVLVACAFIAKRREDPSFTWNAAQDLPFKELQNLLDNGDEAEADPLGGLGGAEPAPKVQDNDEPKI